MIIIPVRRGISEASGGNPQIKIEKESESSTPDIKNQILIIFLVGIIILIIGLSIIIIEVNPIYTSEKPNDLEKDWDEINKTFKSYNTGDKLIISGRINGVVKTEKLLEVGENKTDEILNERFGGKYIYELENDFEVHSNKNLGENGDTVILECKIKELEEDYMVEEIIYAESSHNPYPFIIFGGFLILISIFILIKAIIMRRDSIKAASKPYQLAALYGSKESEDEEAVLIQFMHSQYPRKGAIPTVTGKSTSISSYVKKPTLMGTTSKIRTRKIKIPLNTPPRSPSRSTIRTNKIKIPSKDTLSSSRAAQIKASPQRIQEIQAMYSNVKKIYGTLENEDDEMLLYQSMKSAKKSK